MAIDVRMIGLLRFSVLTPTYYSERFDTLEKTAAHIFSDARMHLRFRIFETLCLPSLLRQTDMGYDCVILTAEAMPKPHLDRLNDLVALEPNLHLRPVGTDKHYQLLKQGYNSIDIGAASHRILFRLDDDDALDVNYVKRTKHLAKGMLRMQDKKRPFIIAHNRGFYVRFQQDGPNEVFDACERAPLSAGTALVAPPDYPRNPYRYNHRALAQHYTTLSDISAPAFIRTIHGDNKSSPTQMGLTHKKKPDRIAKDLMTHFQVGLDELQAL